MCILCVAALEAFKLLGFEERRTGLHQEDPYLVLTPCFRLSLLLANAHKVNVGIDDGRQQRILGVLKHLIPKFGGVAELARGHRHSLDKEHFVQVLVLDVDFAAVGDLFALYSIDEGQHSCVVAPHAFQDFLNMCRGHVAWPPPWNTAFTAGTFST